MIRWPFLSRRKHEAEMAKTISHAEHVKIVVTKINEARRPLLDKVESLTSTFVMLRAERDETRQDRDAAWAELAQFPASRDRQLANLRLGTAASAAKRKERAGL